MDQYKSFRALREHAEAQGHFESDVLRVQAGQEPQYYALQELQHFITGTAAISVATPHNTQAASQSLAAVSLGDQGEAPMEQLSSEEFIQELKAFHQQRGTALDPAPRVNGKQIDLQKLYQHVAHLGGYDQVSREKLAWRKVGHEFGLGATNAAAYAFALKTAYYKNLAAFEIKHLHNKEPPPKTILEDVTAKGGDLLTRTIQSYRHPTVEDGEGSGVDEVTTPTGDKMDIDEPGSGTGRSTRGLRQAPPQRVLFQPDVSSSRQTRTATGQGQSPQPTATAQSGYSSPAGSNQHNMPHSISSYEPRPPMPLTLRGVTTPANNSTRFYQEKQQAQGGQHRKAKDMTKPGCGYQGPNIYVRTLQALRSGIQEEQYYSLHHLVKISHERGDKFKYEAFPGLAEALIEFTIGITSVYYDIHWKFDYSEKLKGINILDCINGTQGIVERLKSMERIDHQDELEPEELSMKFQKVKEAALAFRNLTMMEDNAHYVADLKETRDMLTIILSLPNDPRLVELKLYMLEVAEMVIRFWVMPEDDPLYRILLKEVDESPDRAAIIISLRAICRISMNLENHNFLGGAWLSLLQRLFGLLLLQDEELVGESLHFYYQYTAFPANVATLLLHANSIEHSLPALLKRLAAFLRYGEKEYTVRTVIQDAVPEITTETIPNVPDDLLRQLLAMDEPERSNTWLKCVFEEHKDSEVTQIALWQAYRSRFESYSHAAVPNAPGLLPAAEFIKNVSLIFENATAQVVNGPSSKFIIKGIRPRRVPVDLSQHPYLKCLWTPPGAGKPCGEFLRNPEDLYYHAIKAHCGVVGTKGNWDTSDAHDIVPGLDCYWAGDCHRFTANNKQCVLEPCKLALTKHIKTMHIPDSRDIKFSSPTPTSATTTHPFTPNKLGPNGAHDPRLLAQPDGITIILRSEIGPDGRKEIAQYTIFYNTPVDEKGEPAGLSLLAALILRNIARNIPKAADLLRSPDTVFETLGLGPGRHAMQTEMEAWGLFGDQPRWKRKEVWMGELMGSGSPLWEDLMWTLAYNKTLGSYINEILALVRKGIVEA
ncbi:MAG: hypothetical protein Q9201_002317 [Fulgogasparrea decipioides]